MFPFTYYCRPIAVIPLNPKSSKEPQPKSSRHEGRKSEPTKGTKQVYFYIFKFSRTFESLIIIDLCYLFLGSK